jgi:RNA polymerase sigma factor (sigma-70 family)
VTPAGAADLASERPVSARRKWTLTQEAFEWRGCSTPDEYADETINRCAKKIDEGEAIREMGTYAIGVARMVLREMARDRSRQARPLEEAPEPSVMPAEPDARPESRLECLRNCLGQLSPDTRDLILHYYQGDKGNKIKSRKSLTERLGIPANTLRMRALRVRERLQLCMEACLKRRAAA